MSRRDINMLMWMTLIAHIDSGFSHAAKETNVPLYILSKLRITQLVKSYMDLIEKKFFKWYLFALVNTLFVAVIFRFIKVNLVHLKKKNQIKLSQSGKCLICHEWRDFVKRTLFRMASTLRYTRIHTRKYAILCFRSTEPHVLLLSSPCVWVW